MLLLNNYPLHLIFRIINKRLNFLFSKKSNGSKAVGNADSVEQNTRFFILPFVPDIAHNMKDNIKDGKMQLSFHIEKWDVLLKHTSVNHFDQKNTVYCILCDNCDATYVGQTGRKLKTRINEHKRNIAKTDKYRC